MVVAPGGHVGRLPLSLSTCPPGFQARFESVLHLLCESTEGNERVAGPRYERNRAFVDRELLIMAENRSPRRGPSEPCATTKVPNVFCRSFVFDDPTAPASTPREAHRRNVRLKGDHRTRPVCAIGSRDRVFVLFAELRILPARGGLRYEVEPQRVGPVPCGSAARDHARLGLGIWVLEAVPAGQDTQDRFAAPVSRRVVTPFCVELRLCLSRLAQPPVRGRWSHASRAWRIRSTERRRSRRLASATIPSDGPPGCGCRARHPRA